MRRSDETPLQGTWDFSLHQLCAIKADMVPAFRLLAFVVLLCTADSVVAAPDLVSRLPTWRTNVTHAFTVEKRYLNLPVKNGAPRRLVSLLAQGNAVRQFEIELADQAPDFWVFLDLTPFTGESLVIQVDQLKEDSNALEQIEQSETIRDGNLYRESVRPQFHFTSKRGWNNDPNGLVYHQGEYHLFYQHNPYGWNWGNMHWGHAVSPDLVHWRELGEALYPDSLGTMFSGSAVVDSANTAGFNQHDHPAMVCVYTAAGGTSRASEGRRFSQCLAYSTNAGRTWTKYESNPVLPHIIAENRDPKVIWYEPERKWVMALYLDKSDYALFSSPDLKRWERMSDVSIPGTSECPEFFEIPVEGERGTTRWIFYGGNGRYSVGIFDGTKFAPESGPHSLNLGNCFYASQTYNHIPVQDGRRILIAWGQVNLPGMPFNQMMDFPVELTLRRTEAGLRLFAVPAREIERLRGTPTHFNTENLPPGVRSIENAPLDAMEVQAEFDAGNASEVGLLIHGISVNYDTKTQELSCLQKKAPLPLAAGRLQLRLLVDLASIEIFANGGQVYMPMGIVLDKSRAPLAIVTRGAEAKKASLTVYPLSSIWNSDVP
jgi:sucrose-6-phosphate hydrolase SacC (GH32 family)